MRLLVIGGLFREVIIDGQGKREVRFAGSALYAASAASRLGASVTMIAPVGSEDLELAQKLAEEMGIDAKLTVGTGASGTFGYERRGGLLLSRGYRPSDSRPELDFPDLPAAPNLSLLFGHPEHDPTESAALSDLVSGGTLLFDRQGWMSATPTLDSALRIPAKAHIALANMGELTEEFGYVPDPGTAPPDGWKMLIAKDGRWGVHLLSTSSPLTLPAYCVDAVDELGSGDVFAGAFAAAILNGMSDDLAARTANAAAAASVSTSGSLVDEDFVTRIDQLLELGEARMAVPPLRRAAVEISIDAPPGFAGDVVLESLTQNLRREGFAPSLADRTAAVPTVCVDGQIFELTDSDLDPLDWLQGQLAGPPAKSS